MSTGYFGCMNNTGYEWVRGNRTKPATKGVLVIKIGVIAILYKPRGVIEIMIQTSRCYSNFEKQKCTIAKTTFYNSKLLCIFAKCHKKGVIANSPLI